MKKIYKPMLSIVIPIYNEQKILLNNMAFFNSLSNTTELIFVDGGSSDKSVEIANQYGKVLHSKKGRAAQMNRGGYSAKGNILLFLHVDNAIAQNTLTSIEKAVSENGFIGGCLTQRIDKKSPVYRFIEAQGNIRARLTKVFYGDQGIFVRKDAFFAIGGFPQTSIMEDALFTKKMRDFGKRVILPDKILVSPRRWEKKGILKTILLYNLIIILSWLKMPLTRIKSLYKDLR